MNDKTYYKLCFSVLRDECSLSVNLSGEWTKCRLECAHFGCGALTNVAREIVIKQLRRNVRLWRSWIPFIYYFVHETHLLRINIFRFNMAVSTWIIHTTKIFCGAATQRGSWPPHSWGFLDHTQRRTTVGRTPLDEWSVRCRDLYFTTHTTHNRQISMPPMGFEPTISAGQRPQTHALDRAATRTVYYKIYKC